MFSRQAYSVALASCLLFGLLISAGCGSKEAAPPSTDVVKEKLLGKVWYCEMLFEREVGEDSKITIEFMPDLLGAFHKVGQILLVGINHTTRDIDEVLLR